ncbi:MAG: MBL fold metallo-hydrolase [Cyclobacteriaceae bacterium]|nr:MBL fold metallo-hydrolase [Cyclobacteriaceae bacterium]MCK5367575.1 MBL fold metallo-hydrolase [Cyclobacteriaceae bacterium]
MNKILSISLVLIIGACSQKEQKSTGEGVISNFTEIEENTITNLYDAFGEDKSEMQKDFGFSCILKYKGKTILFDAGSNADIFKKNVQAMNIDLTQIDIAIASHSHFDHINGFDYLLQVNPDVKIYFPFDLFWGANIPFDISGEDSTITDSLDKKMQYFGGDFESYEFNQTGRFWNANIEFIKENREIAPGIKLISTSSPNMGYFSQYPKVGIVTKEDDIHDHKSSDAKLVGLKEISLSLETQDGEVLIVGCSHSTVEKIVAKAKSYTHNQIAMVYGGYHLLPYDRKTLVDLSIRLKEELEVKKVAPAHCTGHLAFKILLDEFGDNYLYAGLGETINF